ncbi:MAG: sulfotransferase [Candidatus Thermoplasmatota archaeon]
MKKIHNYEIDPFNVTFEPLAGSTFTNLIRLIAQNHFKIDPIGIPRILYSATLSLALSPLNIYEKKWFEKKEQNIKIENPPIFIIGHWRTGSTYLHNLLSQDPRFGYPTTLQTVTPAICLKFEKLIKPLVDSSLPETRPEDDVKLGSDLPQEEEYALGNLSPFSFYNGWCFPKNIEKYHKYVDLKNTSQKTREEFKKIYLHFIKKITYYHQGKRLVIKNPSNTARIKILLEMFPNSKFIYIYRNPYHVYLSMKKNIEKEMTLYTLQNPPPWKKFEKQMVDLYKRMFKNYSKQKKLIPEKNLVEVKYERFIKKPVEETQRIYKKLDLKKFEENKKIFKEYIKSKSNIKTTEYNIDKKMKKRIYKQLHETIELWGYDV